MQFDRAFPTHPSYGQLHDQLSLAHDTIVDQRWPIDRVIGLARGGLFPAMLLSHALDVPMTAIHYSSKKGEGEFKMYDNHTAFAGLMSNRLERCLVVDDICDSGHTFNEVVDALGVLKVHPVMSYAIYFKEREDEVFRPTFHTYTIPEDAPWIIFPWEEI